MKTPRKTKKKTPIGDVVSGDVDMGMDMSKMKALDYDLSANYPYINRRTWYLDCFDKNGMAIFKTMFYVFNRK